MDWKGNLGNSLPYCHQNETGSSWQFYFFGHSYHHVIMFETLQLQKKLIVQQQQQQKTSFRLVILIFALYLTDMICVFFFPLRLFS